MSSAQQQIKRTTKFNYLIQQDNQQKLAKYDKMNFSPNIYKKKYESNQLEQMKQSFHNKNKENTNQNVIKHQKTDSKRYTSNNVMNQNSNEKHGLISFGKNRYHIQKQNAYEDKRSQKKFHQQQSNNENNKKRQSIQRLRAKSFGNISLKKQIFQDNKYQTNKYENSNKYENTNKYETHKYENNKRRCNNELIQFSPYQQELNSSLINECKPNEYNKNELNYQFRIEQNSHNKGQNLLIYELQQQQLIVRKQLKQYEYQNEILKQKIQYLQSQNYQLKQFQKKFQIQLQSKQSFYQNNIQSLHLDIKQLQQQSHIYKLENQQLIIQINNHKQFINSIQHQNHLLITQNQDLQAFIKTKQSTIDQLKTKIQLIQINQTQYSQHARSKRRKSLDLSSKGRNIQQIQNKLNLSQLNDQKSYADMYNQKKQQASKNSHIGKLMNKTSNNNLNFRTQLRLQYKDLNVHESTQDIERKNYVSSEYFYQTNKAKLTEPQKNLTMDKYISFVESIKSMYFKITNKETNDLKQLWKWLKLIAHQYQSFILFYDMREEIYAVLDDLQCRKQTNQIERQLSFMDKQCYKIIKKLAQIIQKNT